MKIQAIIHKAEEGGYWAEFPALPGCFTQGETREELMRNIREAIECHLGGLSVGADAQVSDDAELVTVAYAAA